MLTYSAETAEDVVQEAFARLHRRFDTLENPAGYLRVSVVNLVRETHRRRMSEERNLCRLPGPAVWAPADGSELLDVLGRLPERQRIVLVLRY